MTALVAYKIPQFRTTTLNVVGGITAADTDNIKLTAIPADITITEPGIVALTYSNPIDTTKIEWVTYTSIDGTNVLQGVTRGAEDWAAHTHENGAIVAWVVSKSHINQIMDAMAGVTTGVSFNAPTFTGAVAMTSPKITTSIDDANGLELLKVTATATAVNELTLANAATGGQPTLSATGGDTKISPVIKGKAAFITTHGLYDCGAVGATETVSWKNGDRQKLTLDENLTITFGDAVAGQTLTLYMLQDGTGTNTITFADTIVWADGTTPSWTTTADKYNIAVIFYDGSGYYGVGNKFA